MLTHVKLTSNLTDIIYSLGSTRTLFRVHQFKPVLKIIQAPSARLLLADEVGLGKTIEAGLIWAELDARAPTRRTLVVCPSGLRTKWQLEMRRRFDREMEIVDRSRFLELLNLYQERGDAARFSVIASYNTLRHDDVIDSLSRQPPTLDLVIADEAHAMRNSETRTHQLGELLAQNSSALLLLSATPVNLGSTDLLNLCRLLYPDQFGDPDVFERMLAPNAHLIAAVKYLTSTSEPDGAAAASILENVESTAEAARFQRNPLYTSTLDHLRSSSAMTPADVMRACEAISSLNSLATVYNRTRKRDLTDHRVVRRPVTLSIELQPVEEEIYRGALGLVTRLRKSSTGSAVGLASVMPARQASSCIPVMGSYLEDLIALGRLETDFDEGEEDDEDQAQASNLNAEQEALSYAQEIIGLCRKLHGVDTKLSRLVDFLRELKGDGTEQVLLFSFFRRTLSYLHEQLSLRGFRCAVMHGQTPTRVRDDLMRDFRNGKIDILLCSEIGSEGLDFEFCHALVNYDLPWNPMRLEQRIGRIDRFGQASSVVQVINFEVPGTIDTEIFLRLYTRIGVFENSIGELEPILGEKIQDLNRFLATSALTVEEQTRLANSIAVAVERERSDLEEYEATRDRLVGADAFVSDSLERAYAEKRYVTADELERYVGGFLREETAPAKLGERSPDNVVAMIGSPALADVLRAYGRRWQTPEFLDLVARLETGSPVAVTFDPETAYGRVAEFIHSRHPIVRAISDFYDQDPSRLPLGGYVRTSRTPSSSWIYFVYKLTAGGLLPTRTLLPVAWNRETGELDLEVGRSVLSYLASDGPARMSQSDLPIIEPDEVERAFSAAEEAIVEYCEETQLELQQRNDALISVRQEALNTGLDVQRSRLNELAARPELNERIRRMRLAQIANLERRTQDSIAQLDTQRRIGLGFKAVAAGVADLSLDPHPS